MKGSKILAASIAALGGLAGVTHAAVSVTRTADASSFSGSPAVNTAGTAANSLSSTFNVGIGLAAGSNNRFGQSFTTGASGFTLASISMYNNGQGGSTGLGLHLYAGVNGGTEADSFVNPNNPTPTDLLGGGSGLTFDIGPSGTNGFVNLTFSGADQVALAPNTKYYIEFAGGSAAVNILRAGSSPYAGGNAYLGSDPAANRGLPSSGGVRDSAFAVYAVTPAPEPAALAALGLGGVSLIKRRRRA